MEPAEKSLMVLREVNDRIPERHFHEHAHILYDIRTLLGPDIKTYVEIGSYVGSSACLLLSHPFPTRIICIDPCVLNKEHYLGAEEQYETLAKNLSENQVNKNSNFEIFKGQSCDKLILDKLRNVKIDLLFIDGHGYQQLLDDFNNYASLVSPGGYIVFDDYLDDDYSPEVRTAVNKIVDEIDKNLFQIIGTPVNKHNSIPTSPSRFVFLNEFIIRRNPINYFAVVIPTYNRKNGTTVQNIKNIVDFLSKQTYQNYHVFLVGDDYDNEEEFKYLISLFPQDKIYAHNNSISYRKDYFSKPVNKWCIGGVMALKHGVEKAKEYGYKYYLHLDDDDSWTHDKLQAHFQVLEEFPKADFIFHGSQYYQGVLPQEHREYPLEYNNLRPAQANIVHSSNCLSLNDKSYKMFMDFTNSVTEAAENIKNKVIEEHDFQPFDASLINYLLSKDAIFLYISKVLSSKNSDYNVPE